MNEKTKAFLAYMLDDYMDCCICDYIEDDDFPFGASELQEIKKEIEKMIGRQ